VSIVFQAKGVSILSMRPTHSGTYNVFNFMLTQLNKQYIKFCNYKRPLGFTFGP